MTLRQVAPADRPSELHLREEVMGTVVTIDLFDVGTARLETIGPHVARALAALHDADRTFSTWKWDSPMSRIRRGELSVQDAPADVAEVLDACEHARARSGGWFDPWSLPGGVDPTGYVKGWAAQRAVSELAAAGVTGAIVNAAGDVASVGSLVGGQPFRIGIANPATPMELSFVVELRGAIATSGTYERGAHLIDPRDGRPSTRAASASVVGPDLGLADALATALAVGGDEVLALVGALDRYEGLTIAADGETAWTAGFPFAPTT